MSLERPKDAFKRKQETEYGVTGKRGEESYHVSVISIKEAVGGPGCDDDKGTLFHSHG